jgi:ABC-type nitrate/sulfonate/bicarbonate transport system substrate-binding protein
MFTDRYKRSAGIIFFAVLWVAIAAEAARGQAKQEDIAIGYASRSGVMTPLYVAQEQGLFKKHGLGVKELLLLRGTGPAAAQMLVAGTAPIAALGGALVEGAIRGAGIAYIASTSNHLIFSIYSRSEIARPEDLKGTTVAVDAKALWRGQAVMNSGAAANDRSNEIESEKLAAVEPALSLRFRMQRG